MMAKSFMPSLSLKIISNVRNEQIKPWFSIKRKKKKAPLVVTGSQPKGEEADVGPEGPWA